MRRFTRVLDARVPSLLAYVYLNSLPFNHISLLLMERQIYQEPSAQQSNEEDAAAALIDRQEIEVSHETC